MTENFFPSALLVAFSSWPLLVSWLLWAARKAPHPEGEQALQPPSDCDVVKSRRIETRYLGRVLTYSLAGAVLGLIGVGLSWGRVEPICVIFLMTGMVFPLIFFFIRSHNPEQEGEGAEDSLVFLVNFCFLMANCLRSGWAVVFFITIGFVLLAWWDGRHVRRAFVAWQMVRGRLCGAILASVGLALLGEWSYNQGGDNQGVDAALMVHHIGSVFMIAGLGLVASLGRAVRVPPAFGLFDTGLRFSALVLMARLSGFPFAQNIMIVATSVALVLTVVLPSCHKEARFYRSFIMSLGGYAAAYGQMTALIWLYLASFLVEIVALERGEADKEDSRASAPQLRKGSLALIGMVLVMLGQRTSSLGICGVLLCLLIGIMLESRENDEEYWRLWPDQMSAFNVRRDKAAWERLAVLILFFLTFSGLFVLSWHPGFLWSL